MDSSSNNLQTEEMTGGGIILILINLSKCYYDVGVSLLRSNRRITTSTGYFCSPLNGTHFFRLIGDTPLLLTKSLIDISALNRIERFRDFRNKEKMHLMVSSVSNGEL